MRDLLGAPGARAEQEDFALAQLEDHLFVQLTDATAALWPVVAGQKHAVQTAIGDRAGVGDGQSQRERARAHGAVHAVPDQARSQIRELVARVATREHVEHAVEGRTR